MKINDAVNKTTVFCPKCGRQFKHTKKASGKTLGLFSGAALGAKAGAGIGLVGGPLGAIAGTVPGAILGALIGRKLVGVIVDSNPKCPDCGTVFTMPG